MRPGDPTGKLTKNVKYKSWQHLLVAIKYNLRWSIGLWSCTALVTGPVTGPVTDGSCHWSCHSTGRSTKKGKKRQEQKEEVFKEEGAAGSLSTAVLSPSLPCKEAAPLGRLRPGGWFSARWIYRTSPRLCCPGDIHLGGGFGGRQPPNPGVGGAGAPQNKAGGLGP